MSKRAADALAAAEVIVGYDTYLGLIADFLPGKKIIGTGMTQEIDRCQAAVEEAMAGRRVAVVSSGDPGIYGMAGLVLELVFKYPPALQPVVDIVPGISAIGAAAALLGAPVMHDFAVISLSDLLTPWETIVKRVEMAAAGDFVIALYNPKSTRRISHIEQVREIVLRHRPATTPVGIVHHASRKDESVVLSDLENFTREHIDMFSLVIIGNSRTYTAAGRMITPRGYSL
ncbi:precorrin-3B C(17)-methyltransferase [Anaeroselena agilis]|uniref:Precorrin-3B C(17)-methyltransferase n=1 Tax=Anaeroselena agilis TaxID=3063788 RepID=A0ABU3NY69_9FIRM|nr:precorrin-3B C(17)-methyltransferase [Selenomonadales bacterium 4137-cl]